MDLQDQINQQIPYIKSLKGDELAIKQTQFQLSSIKQLKSDRPNYAAALTALTKITPKSIVLTNVTMDRNQPPTTSIVITGQTPSNMELAVFIKKLQQDSAFSDIVLTNISFEGQTNFTITGNLSDQLSKT
jgi:Tfp pilus assembly protein PilN